MKKVLILILVIGLGILIYYLYNQNKVILQQEKQIKVEQSMLNEESTQKQIDNTTVDTMWKELSKEDLIKFGKNAGVYSDNYSMDVPHFKEAIDLTGDGINEGVLEIEGPDSASYIILIQNENGTISIAQVKSESGTIAPIIFGAWIAGPEYKLLPKENGFYVISYSDPFSNIVVTCTGLLAYKWNAQTRLFEFNQTLTTKYKAEDCN